jgi:hypothetical protein
MKRKLRGKFLINRQCARTKLLSFPCDAPIRYRTYDLSNHSVLGRHDERIKNRDNLYHYLRGELGTRCLLTLHGYIILQKYICAVILENFPAFPVVPATEKLRS